MLDASSAMPWSVTVSDQPEQHKSLAEIAVTTRYPLDAFHFVRRGLDYTVHRCHKNPEELPEGQRHVSGRQLSEGLRDYAIEQYGLLAGMMLKRWRICRTEDFGQIVFSMVNGGLMQASPSDSLDDFADGFDFAGTFSDVRIAVDHIPIEDPAHKSTS